MRTLGSEAAEGFDKFVRNKFGRTQRSAVRPKGENQDGFHQSLSPPNSLELKKPRNAGFFCACQRGRDESSWQPKAAGFDTK